MRARRWLARRLSAPSPSTFRQAEPWTTPKLDELSGLPVDPPWARARVQQEPQAPQAPQQAPQVAMPQVTTPPAHPVSSDASVVDLGGSSAAGLECLRCEFMDPGTTHIAARPLPCQPQHQPLAMGATAHAQQRGVGGWTSFHVAMAPSPLTRGEEEFAFPFDAQAAATSALVFFAGFNCTTHVCACSDSHAL